MTDIKENMAVSPQRRLMVGVIITILVFVVLLMSAWAFGSGGMFKVLLWAIIIFVILGVIGLVFLLVIKLLFKGKIDMVEVVQRRIEEGAEMRKPDNDVHVYLSGDNEDFERKHLGLLSGISKTKIRPDIKELSKKPKEVNTDIHYEKDEKWFEVVGEVEDFYFLLIKQGLFSKPKIIGVFKKDMSNPNMDNIYIKDTTLSPPFGGVFYPAKYDQRTDVVEIRMTDYVKKYSLEDFLRDFKVIVDDAIQSSPEHQKDMEKGKILDRIAGMGEQQ